MKNINVNAAYEEYNINGKIVVRFNPLDSEFVKRFIAAAEALADCQEKFGNDVQGVEPDNFFAISEQTNAKMREIINGLFGEDVCTPIWDAMHLTALSDGLPIWCDLMLALMDEIHEAMSAKKQKMERNPRLDKYLAKYQKKNGK